MQGFWRAGPGGAFPRDQLLCAVYHGCQDGILCPLVGVPAHLLHRGVPVWYRGLSSQCRRFSDSDAIVRCSHSSSPLSLWLLLFLPSMEKESRGTFFFPWDGGQDLPLVISTQEWGLSPSFPLICSMCLPAELSPRERVWWCPQCFSGKMNLQTGSNLKRFPHCAEGMDLWCIASHSLHMRFWPWPLSWPFTLTTHALFPLLPHLSRCLRETDSAVKKQEIHWLNRLNRFFLCRTPRNFKCVNVHWGLHFWVHRIFLPGLGYAALLFWSLFEEVDVHIDWTDAGRCWHPVGTKSVAFFFFFLKMGHVTFVQVQSQLYQVGGLSRMPWEGREGGLILLGEVREGYTLGVMFVLGLGRWVSLCRANESEGGIPGTENSKCKGPEVWKSMVHLGEVRIQYVYRGVF